MQHLRASHPALRRFVRQYVGYHHVLDPRATHHGLPGPVATVVLAFDEPLDVGWLGHPATHVRRWRIASGLHPAPALIRTHGHQHGIQLDLTPAGVRALLGAPVGAFGAALADHDDLPLGIGEADHARIASTDSWDLRFDLLDRALLRILDDDTAVALPEVTRAWDLLARARGRIAPSTLAAEVGWSRRHLGSRFAAEYGLTLQQAAGVFRFHHARLLAGRGVPLAETAHLAGYADQAHLSREWRRHAGLTPTQTIGDLFRIVQDESPQRLASSPA